MRSSTTCIFALIFAGLASCMNAERLGFGDGDICAVMIDDRESHFNDKFYYRTDRNEYELIDPIGCDGSIVLDGPSVSEKNRKLIRRLSLAEEQMQNIESGVCIKGSGTLSKIGNIWVMELDSIDHARICAS